MAAIEACRTPALGGHAEQCADCGFVRYAYNSCRDRHFGFLANRHRAEKLALCRKLLAAPTPQPPSPRRWQERLFNLTGQDVELCPCCGGRMQTTGIMPPQPSRPATWCDSS